MLVDMTRFLRRSLTNQELLKLEDKSYEGFVSRVVEELVYNKWRFTNDELVPLIEFCDGWTWIPNQRCRMALMKELGPETDHWAGQHLRVYLKEVARAEPVSGRAVEKLEKFVEVLGDSGPRS
jgi:hypothetical protein